MPKKDHLAALINSLTPAEKKYFVQFTQLRSDDKSYMKLYDAVLKSGEYNIESLSKELNKTKANLAHEKEYLIENILKALRNFHDDMPEVRLYNRLQDVAILNERGLYELSKTKNNKAIELAEKQSRFEICRITTDNEELLAYQTSGVRAYMQARHKLLSKLEKNLERLHTDKELFKLLLQVDTAYQQHPINLIIKQTRQVQKLLKHKLLNTKFQEPFFIYLQLKMLSKIYQMLRNKEKTLHVSGQILTLIEKYPHQLQANSNTYFQAAHNYLLDFLFRQPDKDLKGFQKIFNNLKKRYSKLPFDQTFLNNKFSVNSYIYYLPIYGRMAWWQTISPETVYLFVNNFEKDEQHIKKYMSYTTWFNCSVRIADLCFVMQDYNRALYWYQKLLNEKEGAHLEPIALYKVKMGFLFAHAQLRNYTLMLHLMESVKRYLHKIGYWQQVEKITFALLARLPHLLTEIERKIAFENYLAELRSIKAGNSIHKRSIHLLLYQEWALMNLGRKN